MAEWADTEAIWKDMPGGNPIYEIYGHWPTLHDAVIRSMNFNYADRGLEIVFDYDDAVLGKEEKKDFNSRITLSWHGITESKLRLYDGDLYGVEFNRRDGLIETRFVDYPWGMDGYILSAGVEVINIEPAPDMSGLHQDDVAGHEIKLSLA